MKRSCVKQKCGPLNHGQILRQSDFGPYISAVLGASISPPKINRNLILNLNKYFKNTCCRVQRSKTLSINQRLMRKRRALLRLSCNHICYLARCKLEANQHEEREREAEGLNLCNGCGRSENPTSSGEDSVSFCLNRARGGSRSE